ncbi:MAG: response regulator transcription factor [Sulfuricella denitrificans]|nr:response regulator transcription factor [Sulfuricella denitrificans]
MRILIVEDDSLLADSLVTSLKQAGYAADLARNGQDADYMLSQQSYDLTVLDLGLPRMDGFQVLRRLRERKSLAPVLILTARDSLEDRVKGLDLGADDYMAKPFELPELEARIRALLRRSNWGNSELVSLGGLSFDVPGRRVYCAGRVLDLPARELGIFEVLLQRAGKVVSKEQLLESLYGWEAETGDNAIEVYVHRLRKKLEGSGVTIATVRGLGYLMDAQKPC